VVSACVLCVRVRACGKRAKQGAGGRSGVFFPHVVVVARGEDARVSERTCSANSPQSSKRSRYHERGCVPAMVEGAAVGRGASGRLQGRLPTTWPQQPDAQSAAPMR
jgi:hypothetical protein